MGLFLSVLLRVSEPCSFRFETTIQGPIHVRCLCLCQNEVLLTRRILFQFVHDLAAPSHRITGSGSSDLPFTMALNLRELCREFNMVAGMVKGLCRISVYVELSWVRESNINKSRY